MRSLRPFLAQALALLLFACGPCGLRAEPVNLLPNGDFRTVDERTGIPEGWREHPSDRHSVTVVALSPQENAVRFVGDADRMASGGCHLQENTLIPVEPGGKYRLLARVKSNGPRFVMTVQVLGRAMRAVGGGKKESLEERSRSRQEAESKDGEWHDISLEVEVPRETDDGPVGPAEFARVLLAAYWSAGECQVAGVRLVRE